MSTRTKTATYVQIRWMLRPDLHRVLDIEFESFEDPYTEEQFLTILRQSTSVALVAEVDDKIVGFILYELRHPKRMDILDLAVAHEYRRKRIGTQLITKLQSKLHPMRRTSILVDVRETNLPAQLFFRENGFECVKVLHEHYGTDEAAYRFIFAVGIQ